MKIIKKIKLGLLFSFLLLAVTAVKAQVSVSLSIRTAPPALPVYVQPACPVDGYLWVPGYWAYDNDAADYYWVPGYWAAPPGYGLLWTPPYWGYNGGVYVYHAGYWGAHVGYYGGINYGFGYGGSGYGGGMWVGNSFRYNTAVANVNTTIVHNTYVDRTVINNVTVNNHNSFNGPGGSTAKPRPQELAAMKETHVEATAEQTRHEQRAGSDKTQFAKNNGGRPTVTAMDRIGGHTINNTGNMVARANRANAAEEPITNPAPVNRPNTAKKPAKPQEAARRPVERPHQVVRSAQRQVRRPLARPERKPEHEKHER